MQVLSLPDLYGESDDGLESGRDDEVYELESETEESIVVSKTEEELTESSDDEEEAHSEVLSSSAKKQKTDNITTWGKKGKKWTVPDNFQEYNEKLRLNPEAVPEGRITCFSNAIDFYNLFVTEELIDYIFQQTRLYNEWRSLHKSVRRIKNIERNEIKTVIGVQGHEMNLLHLQSQSTVSMKLYLFYISVPTMECLNRTVLCPIGATKCSHWLTIFGVYFCRL